MATPPTLDGVIDTQKEWKDIPFEVSFVDSETNQVAPYATTFWMGYDAQYIYFAARMVDPNPKSIRATEYRTNVNLEGNDTIGLSIDTFGNLSDFNQFKMNASGGTSLSIAGGRAAKREWIGNFVSKGRVTAEGWEVEARIPWELIKLPASGVRDLRFNVTRFMGLDQRYYSWCYVAKSIEMMGTWKGVDLPRIVQRRTLKLLPFGYIGGLEGREFIFDGGLDLKTSLNDQIEFVGTVKPDFRNIENSILSLDHSYFEQIASESRPFFQEGQSNFSLGGDQKIFLSQRLHDFDAGAKAYGKLSDNMNFGFLNTTTFGVDNATVGSLTYFPDKVSSIKVAGTNYQSDSVDNQASWISLNRQFGPTGFYFQNMSSFDSVRGQGSRTNSGLFYGDGGLSLYGEYVQVTSDFHPAIGYSPEQDLKGVNGSMEYGRPVSKWGLSEAGGSISFANYQNGDGTHYRGGMSVSTSTTWKDGTDLDCFYSARRFNGFDDHEFTIDIEKPRNETYRHWDANATFGEFQGVNYSSYSASTSYRPVQMLQVNLSYQVVQYGGYEDQGIFSANWDLGHDQSIAGRLVSRSGDVGAYIAWRKSGNRGNEYFVILGNPNTPSFEMSLILKATFPIEIRL